jgi:hypothetical protein
MFDAGCEQVVNFATRAVNTLDLFFTIHLSPDSYRVFTVCGVMISVDVVIDNIGTVMAQNIRPTSILL